MTALACKNKERVSTMYLHANTDTQTKTQTKVRTCSCEYLAKLRSIHVSCVLGLGDAPSGCNIQKDVQFAATVVLHPEING